MPLGLGPKLLLTSFLFLGLGWLIVAWVDSDSLDTRLRSELERYKAIPERREASLSTLRGFDPGNQLYQRVGSKNIHSRKRPQTTAVILNWSRFENVRLISSLLCGEWLDSVIAEVFIWNNNPQKISRKDFEGTGCPRRKLRIYNSPANEFFQARFIACTHAYTPYCFIQDDDYLVSSSVIHSLVHRLSLDTHGHSIHLLPSHEHLTTSLRRIRVESTDPGRLSTIHTSPAWLGHGAILHRSEAVEFLQLLQHLNVSEPERKMADNYYSILSNQVPEIWFDQGIELGGGQPFTVGSEGDERNDRHMLRAAEYLTEIVESVSIQNDLKLPYIFLGDRLVRHSTNAVCGGLTCVLETTIDLLPSGMVHTAPHARDMLSIGNKNLEVLGLSGQRNYINYPPSFAVDGNPETYFQSIGDVKQGEMIMLDFISNVQVPQQNSLEMAWIVDTRTVQTLRESTFSFSLDGSKWVGSIGLSFHAWYLEDSIQVTAGTEPICHLLNLEDPTSHIAEEDIFECSISLHSRTVQAVRTQFTGSGGAQRGQWKVYEIWLRQKLLDT
ncbi:hypothetical protein QCA50_002214 [Cerrena zonata]|uniref:Uncharacterized protein n=1 Tax=Cerrena zonata TaxID=2478898 RepID=A0AAW0GYR7_9APHY